eukprot:gene18465-22034_t
MSVSILDAIVQPFLYAAIQLVGNVGNATLIAYATGFVTVTGLGIYAYGLANIPSQAIGMVGSLASFCLGSFLANGQLGTTPKGGFAPDFGVIGLILGVVAALMIGVLVGIVFPPGSRAEKVAFIVAAVLAINLGYTLGSV